MGEWLIFHHFLCLCFHSQFGMLQAHLSSNYKPRRPQPNHQIAVTGHTTANHLSKWQKLWEWLCFCHVFYDVCIFRLFLFYICQTLHQSFSIWQLKCSHFSPSQNYRSQSIPHKPEKAMSQEAVLWSDNKVWKWLSLDIFHFFAFCFLFEIEALTFHSLSTLTDPDWSLQWHKQSGLQIISLWSGHKNEGIA